MFDYNPPTGSGYDKEMHFSPFGPILKNFTPSTGPRGPSQVYSCTIYILPNSYKGIYIQNTFTLLLLDLDIQEVIQSLLHFPPGGPSPATP